MLRVRGRLTDAVDAVFGGDARNGCGCRLSFEDDTLVVDADDCDAGGRIETQPSCRAQVVDALTDRDVETIRVTADGLVRAYEDAAAALLVAAGRFAEAVNAHDDRLALRAKRDPLGAAHEATGRADATAAIAAESGLAELAARASDYESGLSPFVGPTVSVWRVTGAPPADATLVEVRDLDTGGTVRRYTRSSEIPVYHLEPLERELSPPEYRVLAAAYERLARGTLEGGTRAAGRAVRAVLAETGEEGPAIDGQRVTTVLRKHASGYGLLADLFADPRLSDAFVTTPPAETRLRVTVDDDTLETNIRLTGAGVSALSSRFRRESGRAFSRADPTLDATVDIAGRRVRVAGVTEPTSEGTAFAFRAHGGTAWTLPALVDNGTLTAPAAAILSVAVERGRSVLIAGPRGAGKTTLLGALLWELPPTVRTVVIEDAPELPVAPLQSSGRDVQALRASDGKRELSPSEALRTALRLGDGALVVGEVRGEEAGVLYEAMRVGANSEAVLGTVHGDGADAVYERVVTDLDVDPSAFGVTDAVVTLEQTAGGRRQLRSIEEVTDDEAVFRPLFEREDDALAATGRIDRGRSQLVAAVADPGETYATVRESIAARERLLAGLAARGSTDGEAVTESHGRR
ncbi:MAG: type II/IV secretion system ATPase subunit [Halovenus sp.]